jgi:hypothetical protein
VVKNGYVFFHGHKNLLWFLQFVEHLQ